MTAAAWAEGRLALAGALRLARGDPQGLGLFDASLDGFWRSFRAALIAYPFYLILLALRDAPAGRAASSGWRILAVETIGYVISWVAFPLLVLPLTRWLGRAHRFLLFMVAYNWCQVPQTVLFVAIGLAIASGHSPSAALLDIAAATAVLVYEWFVARVALDIGRGQAVVVVGVDLALGSILSRVTAILS